MLTTRQDIVSLDLNMLNLPEQAPRLLYPQRQRRATTKSDN